MPSLIWFIVAIVASVLAIMAAPYVLAWVILFYGWMFK